MKNEKKKLNKKILLGVGAIFGFAAAVAYSAGAYTWQTVGGATGKFYNGTNSLDAVYDLGKVGIGTTTPAFDLHVEGTTNLGGDVYHEGDRINIGGKWTDGSTSTQAVYMGGDVGIGVSDPQGKLHVSDVTAASGGVELSNSFDKINMTFSLDTDNQDFRISYAGSGAPDIAIQADGDVVFNAGNVGIGMTAPSVALEVVGTITSDEFIYSSDKRLKENITNLNNYSNILNISPKRFDWIEKDGKGTDNGDIGVIAQDVEKYFPELVTEREDGYKGVNYQKLIVPMLGVLKDQQKQIEELQKQINELK